MIILHREAMDTIHTLESIDIEFVTADEKRKIGGEIKTINGGWLAWSKELTGDKPGGGIGEVGLVV